MFTGIIEELGVIKSVSQEGSNLRLSVYSPMVTELKIDQSVAHNGVCLTVEAVNADSYEVVAVKETLDKTNLSTMKKGDAVNLERCMQMNGRLDGHIVQGHVDETATVSKIEAIDGSWLYEFQLTNPSKLIVEKGSICINGVSLTAFDVTDTTFRVTIIPFTYEHTGFKSFETGTNVNIEFDILGKYVQRILNH